MSINKRKHIRLTLDIPAVRIAESGERNEVMLHQISIGGCLIGWEENFEIDQEFRLEIQLPNKNWLPLQCKIRYMAKNDGLGTQFQAITQFEQELIGQVMERSLAEEGLPVSIDPFSAPKFYSSDNTQTVINSSQDIPNS